MSGRPTTDDVFWTFLAQDWAAMTFGRRRALFQILPHDGRAYYAHRVRRAARNQEGPLV